MKFLNYFYGATEILPNTELKSGQIGENFFENFFEKHLETKPYVQEKFKNFRFDFSTNHIIYEIKNYLYDSTGTADEKILYGMYKYANGVPVVTDKNSNREVIFILCAKLEHIFVKKYLDMFLKNKFFSDLNDKGVFITLASDVISDYNFNSDKMSFLKWVGGKSKVLTKFIDKIPNEGETYYEPFLGSGAVLIEVLKTKHFKHYVVGDSNKPLICLFGMIKTNLDKLLESLEQLTTDFENSDNKEEFYYNIRAEYNSHLNKILEHLIETASKFLFLNKTCFRGLYRVNKSGEFNVPYGNYKNPTIYNRDELIELNKLFQNVNFRYGDYKHTLLNVTENDFVYLDPPYLNTFDSYSIDGFDSEDFADYVNNMSCNCLLHNSEDFAELLNDFEIENIEVQNKINSKSPGSTRTEIIAWKL